MFLSKRLNHPNLLILILLMAFSIHLSANTLSKASFIKVGASDLSILWFDIYHAELWSHNGLYTVEQTPLLLELNYKRNIANKKLISYTREQLQGKVDPQRLDNWLPSLRKIWPNIKKGDKLSFHQVSSDMGEFYYQDNYIGTIKGTNFAHLFINIWLSEQSEYPKHARQLINKH